MKHLKSLSSLAVIAALGVSLSACGNTAGSSATAPSVDPLSPFFKSYLTLGGAGWEFNF